MGEPRRPIDVLGRLEMRALRHRVESPPIILVAESVDLSTLVRQKLARIRRKVRHAMCYLIHGGHELYRARTDTKLYQQCLLCGYETTGWTIDRRDRRLHLVGPFSKDKRP